MNRISGYQAYDYDETNLIPKGACNMKYNQYKKYIENGYVKNKTVSDLGCGEGFHGIKTALNGAKSVNLVDHWGRDKIHKNLEVDIDKVISIMKLKNVMRINTDISQYTVKSDVVIAFAIIHWLYSFSDIFGSLEKIIDHISGLTNELLFIEWIPPTDHATKVRNHLGDNEETGVKVANDYTFDVFLSTLMKHFTTVNKIGKVDVPNGERDIYMACNKSIPVHIDQDYTIVQDFSKNCGTSDVFVLKDQGIIKKVYRRFTEDVYDKQFDMKVLSHYRVEKDALIGVSMTGIGSGVVLGYNMKEAASLVKEENARVAEMIGINQSARTTTVKPAGTTSLTLGTSSGIHAWHNDYYIRRVRVGKNESIYTYLAINHPELVEDEYFRPHDTAVISVPQKAPEGAILRTESPFQLLERVKKITQEWIVPGHRTGSNTHNVSATISLKPEDWEMAGEWMWENREFYNGLSVLPYDGGSYIQAPFEDCTKETYDRMMSSLKNIDLSRVIELTDETDLSGELACAGGACEIK